MVFKVGDGTGKKNRKFVTEYICVFFCFQGMEALVLKVGDVTGKISDKFKLIDGLKFVELGTFTEKTDKKRRQSGEANAKKAKS